MSTTPPPTFEGKAKGYENAVRLAEGVLGRMHGEGRSGKLAMFNGNWYTFEWTGKYDQAQAEGMPTSSLPTPFKFTLTTRP